MIHEFEKLLKSGAKENTIIFYNIAKPLMQNLKTEQLSSVQEERRQLFFEICKYFGKSYKVKNSSVKAQLIAMLFLNDTEITFSNCIEFAAKHVETINNAFLVNGYEDGETFSHSERMCHRSLYRKSCTAPNCIDYGTWNSQCGGASKKNIYAQIPAPKGFTRNSLKVKYPELFQKVL